LPSPDSSSIISPTGRAEANVAARLALALAFQRLVLGFRIPIVETLGISMTTDLSPQKKMLPSWPWRHGKHRDVTPSERVRLIRTS
jgi:hypothetical protein